MVQTKSVSVSRSVASVRSVTRSLVEVLWKLFFNVIVVFIGLESANDAALGFLCEVQREFSRLRFIVHPDGRAVVAGQNVEFFPVWKNGS